MYLLCNFLAELRVSERKHAIWSHWHKVMCKQFRYQPITQTPTEVHLLFPIILMPLRHPYCQAFPYCPNVSGKVEGHGIVSNHQPSCSEFCPMILCPVPSLNQMTCESRRTAMVITKVDHPYSCPRGTMYPQGASRYLPVLEVNWVQQVMSLGSLVGRYRSLYAIPA